MLNRSLLPIWQKALVVGLAAIVWQAAGAKDKVDKPVATVLHSGQSSLSDEAKYGRALFKKMECLQCHSVNEAGGCLGPRLDGVGSRRSKEYLTLRLSMGGEEKFEKLIHHPELLPHPRLDPEKVHELISYLVTLKTPLQVAVVPTHTSAASVQDEPVKDWSPTQPNPASVEGRRLFYESGCMSCHAIGALGGDLAPQLDGVGVRHSSKYIAAHITNPQVHAKGKRSHMPQFDFMPNEVNSILNFLETLPPEQSSSANAKSSEN